MFDNKTLQVDILGDVYNLKIGENQSEEEVEKIVQLVKSRYNKLRINLAMLPEKKVLVLLSLNIMEELVYEKNNRDIKGQNKEAFVQVLKDIEKLIR